MPEIIDVSSGTVDPLLTRAQEAGRALGFGEGQRWVWVQVHCGTVLNLRHSNSSHCRLTRYETRLLCENTPELVELSVVDINALFERADVERTGNVSLQQFLAEYRHQKRLSAEVSEKFRRGFLVRQAQDYRHFFTQLVFAWIFPFCHFFTSE